MRELLTAGKFAKLCGTTKATLRWYRKIGLLKPIHIGSNEYAYYLASQVVAFSIIRALQNIGCSLEQIKTYNEDKNLLNSDSFLDEQIKQLDQRIDELKNQRAFLSRIRNTQYDLVKEWGEQPAEGDWKIRHCDKECYLVMKAPVVDTAVYQKNLKIFQQICHDIGLGMNTPIIMFLDENSLSNGEFAEGFCVGTKVDDPVALQEKLIQTDTDAIEKPYFVIRKAGNYLVYLNTLPLEADNDEVDISSSNPMIDGQKAALDIALHEGCILEMGMLETPVSTLSQNDGRILLLLELSIAVSSIGKLK